MKKCERRTQIVLDFWTLLGKRHSHSGKSIKNVEYPQNSQFETHGRVGTFCLRSGSTKLAGIKRSLDCVGTELNSIAIRFVVRSYL